MGIGKKAVYIETLQRKIVVRKILSVILVVIALASLVFTGILIHRLSKTQNARALELWQDSDYQAVYDLSIQNLESAPLSTFWLTMKGFSSYQLASAQINAKETELYIDASIYALRKALLAQKNEDLERLHYVLGKAYFLKGEYYADLAIEQLEKARSLSYIPPDLPEYLGLSYSRIGDYKKSIASFTEALGDYPSDLLLLAIARNYAALDDTMNSSAYLMRCIEQTRDVGVRNQARLQLGINLIKDEDWEKAKEEFLNILLDDNQNANAHYYLGDIWLGLGDSVKARAEWRKALRIDPSHALSRQRLSL